MKTSTLCIALMISTGLLATGCDKLGKKKDETSSDDKDTKSSDEKGSKKKDKKDAKASASGTASAADASGTSAPTPVAAGDAKAAAHVPSDCEIVVHLQVSKLMTDPTLTKECVPLIDSILATPNPKDKGFKDFQGFIHDASIDPKKSVQDVIVCVTNVDKNASWALAIGGDMKPDTVLPALQKHNDSKSKLSPIDVAGVKGLGDAKGSVIQLPDGTVEFAENKDLLAKLVPAGDGAQKLNLDLTKELSFGVSDLGMKNAFATGKKAPPELAAIQHANGWIDLATNKATVRLATGSADAAKKLDSLLTLMKESFEKQAAKNTYGEADALKGTSSRIEGNDVLIETTLPPGSLDKAASALATALRQAQAKL